MLIAFLLVFIILFGCIIFAFVISRSSQKDYTHICNNCGKDIDENEDGSKRDVPYNYGAFATSRFPCPHCKKWTSTTRVEIKK